MRVAVLEWVCSRYAKGDSPDLRAEAEVMLLELLAAVHRADCQPVTVVQADTHYGNSLLESWKQDLPKLTYTSINTPTDEAVLEAWLALAPTCQRTFIVAPEIDNTLLRCTKTLDHCNIVNCREPMLTVACDKWLTSQVFAASHVPHPPTCLLSDLCTDWITNHSRTSQQQFIVKSRWGAGCDRCRVVSVNDVFNWLSEDSQHTHAQPTRLQSQVARLANEEYIIQPWMEGLSFSRVALFPYSQRSPNHVTPLQLLPTCQQYLARDAEGNLQLLKTTLAADVPAPDALEALLADVFDALPDGSGGWVGIDLLFSETHREWYVIEINPRLTSSIAALSSVLDRTTVRSLLGVE